MITKSRDIFVFIITLEELVLLYVIPESSQVFIKDLSNTKSVFYAVNV